MRYEFERDDDWTREQIIEAKQEYNSSVKLFRMMLCDNTNFESSAKLLKWFETRRNTPHPVIFDALARMVANTMESHTQAVKHTFEAGNASELRRLLRPFMTEQILKRGRAQLPSLWPLVNLVR